MTQPLGDAGGGLDPEASTHAPDGRNGKNGSGPPKGPGLDHVEFLVERGYRTISDEEMGHHNYVESELTNFVGRRHDQRVKVDGERPKEEAWVAGARQREHERKHEVLQAHLSHSKAMLRAHTATFEEMRRKYESRIALLESKLGIDAA